MACLQAAPSFFRFSMAGAHHPLSSKWSLLEHRVQSDQPWYTGWTSLGAFSTAEDFWKVFFLSLTRLTLTAGTKPDLYLFRGLDYPVDYPDWDDAANKTGGQWVTYFDSENFCDLWELTAECVVASVIPFLNGVVLSVSGNPPARRAKVSFWVNRQDKSDGSELLELLAFPGRRELKFYTHESIAAKRWVYRYAVASAPTANLKVLQFQTDELSPVRFSAGAHPRRFPVYQIRCHRVEPVLSSWPSPTSPARPDFPCSPLDSGFKPDPWPQDGPQDGPQDDFTANPQCMPMFTNPDHEPNILRTVAHWGGSPKAVFQLQSHVIAEYCDKKGILKGIPKAPLEVQRHALIDHLELSWEHPAIPPAACRQLLIDAGCNLNSHTNSHQGGVRPHRRANSHQDGVRPRRRGILRLARSMDPDDDLHFLCQKFGWRDVALNHAPRGLLHATCAKHFPKRRFLDVEAQKRAICLLLNLYRDPPASPAVDRGSSAHSSGVCGDRNKSGARHRTPPWNTSDYADVAVQQSEHHYRNSHTCFPLGGDYSYGDIPSSSDDGSWSGGLASQTPPMPRSCGSGPVYHGSRPAEWLCSADTASSTPVDLPHGGSLWSCRPVAPQRTQYRTHV